MLRRRRIAEKRRKENLEENLNLPALCPERAKKSEEHYHPDPSKWKDIDINTIIECEAGFFCEVLCRLSKEIKCTRNLDDLDDIITLASKFLLASAAKEKAIACKIAASNDLDCPGKHDPDCRCDFDDSIGKSMEDYLESFDQEDTD